VAHCFVALFQAVGHFGTLAKCIFRFFFPPLLGVCNVSLKQATNTFLRIVFFCVFFCVFYFAKTVRMTAAARLIKTHVLEVQAQTINRVVVVAVKNSHVRNALTTYCSNLHPAMMRTHENKKKKKIHEKYTPDISCDDQRKEESSHLKS
jgi:hypothetical protein